MISGRKRLRGGSEPAAGFEQLTIFLAAVVIFLIVSGYYLFQLAEEARFDAEKELFFDKGSEAVDKIMAEASLISHPSPNECIQDPLLYMSPDYILYLSLDHESCLAYAKMLKAPACLDAATVVPVHFNLMFLARKTENFYVVMMKKVRAVLYALFATQKTIKMSVIIWTNDPLRLSTFLGGLDQEDGGKLGSLVHVKLWNVSEYVVDTPFAHGLTERSLNLNDPRNWRGGDLMRLIVLYKFGGFYIDLDIVLLQDLAPLMTRDFVEQWSCFPDQLNGAIMYAKTPKSPLLMTLIAAAIREQDSTSEFAWGRDILSPLSEKQKQLQFQILPNCFFDPLWTFNDDCPVKDGSPYNGFVFDDMFLNKTSREEMADFNLDGLIAGSFGFHWHNGWDNEVEDESPLFTLFKRARTSFEDAWATGRLKRYDIPT